MAVQSIRPLGEASLEVKTPLVREFLDSLRYYPLPGVQEVIPALEIVVVFFNPLQIKAEALTHRIEQRFAQLKPGLQQSSEVLVLPVQFDGPDLVWCAKQAQLSVKEFTAQLCQITFQVAFLGFLPGFAFLMGLPPQLQMPRRSYPRAHVPAKSVALGGPWAGVYPCDSAGGWQLIGSTEVVLFDFLREEPLWWHSGQCVRFEAVN